MDAHDQRQQATQNDSDQLRYYARKLQRHPAYQAARKAARSTRQLLPNAWRHVTQRYRQLPGMVIVGAAKSGTTQLYAYLMRHPRCFGGIGKEIHYFSYYADRPLSWYRSHFPMAWRVNRGCGVCIEGSPSYLQSSEALSRMSDVMPGAKVIAILRDPVARAFSSYQHAKTRHRESRSFLEVVRRQLADGPPNVLTIRDGRRVPNYFSQGYYATHLAALWAVYPREQTMIIDSGELFADTNAICQRVFAFLNLERFDVEPGKVYNRGHYRDVIDPTAAELLRAHYRPHDEQLVALLGKPLSWMADGAFASKSSAAGGKAA